MTEKRFRTGKGIFEEGYPSETIIDNETGKTYYKGYGYYISSKEICKLLNEFHEENKELKEINQDNQDYISSLEEEKNNLQIKLQKIRDYAMEDGEVKQGVIEKVIWND